MTILHACGLSIAAPLEYSDKLDKWIVRHRINLCYPNSYLYLTNTEFLCLLVIALLVSARS